MEFEDRQHTLRNIGKVRTAGRLAVVLLLLAVLSPQCSAQVSNPASGPPTRGENPASAFTGCYELLLGRWWPWSFGGGTILVTPPTRIELLPEPGTKGFEKNGLLIRAIPPEKSMPSGRGGPSYWQVKSGNQVDLVWTDGFTGVTLTLEKHGDELRGWAYPHFDSPTFVPRIAHVRAKRITCAAIHLDRIRAKIAVDPMTSLTPVQIAGQYANPSKELLKRVGPPLHGDNLYIFPDKTYVFCRWADVMANTVFDKGTWSFAGGVLELKSDSEISWDDPELERRFLVVHRSSHTEEMLLVGIDWAVPYFEKKAGDDPELMLLIVGMQREKPISQTEVVQLKAKLMHEAWRPAFFSKRP